MEAIGVGLLGLGVVGGGVAQVLRERREAITALIGTPVVLRHALVRHREKPRVLSPDLLTTQPKDILYDPQVHIVVEVMGGELPALNYIRQALEAGKYVVTANKEVMAKHGPELLALARERGVDIRYEASVGGGIPLITPFRQDFLANHIAAIYAIINGTTNFILTRMAQEGQDFASALSQAQKLGYAEADPSNDIEGIDAAYKLAILATLAFHTRVRPQDVHREGISHLSARDFRYARELGYTIKLLAIGRAEEEGVQVRVHPTFLPQDRLLAKVDGVFNAVQVEGDLTGPVLFYGQGAGSQPTSSAVVADIINLAQDLAFGPRRRPPLLLEPPIPLKPMAQLRTRYYLRMSVADRPGVLAQIARVLGDNQISIASVIQKEVDEAAQTAEIVIMTHLALEEAMQRALAEMARLPKVAEVSNFVRVEG
ncbi:MAG: homoserine dehydrogenase [Chloroflexi bacterium]|nr:homoserine dehydrogenase [Chloroflexota bacterium]